MAPPCIGSDWVINVKNELVALTEARKTRQHCTIFRVPPPLRSVKKEDFTPGLMRFGLYDRDISRPSRVDIYRLEVASAFLETLEKTKDDWDEICTRVVENPEEVRLLYDDISGPELPDDVVRSLLTLDAIFLASVFTYWSRLMDIDKFPILVRLFQEGVFSLEYLTVDVMLLENQMPLWLLRNVLEILYDSDREAANKRLETICKETIIKFSRSGFIPGSGNLYNYADKVVYRCLLVNCDHLLQCLHKVICQGNDNAFNENKGSYISLPTVTQLRSANIRFRGDAIGISEVKFVPGRFRATLYLPKLVIDATTERLWRNLVAYENVRNDRKHEFMQYLQLMDDLIDKERDVEWLRKGKDPVISQNFLGNDKDVANMFNSLVQTCHPSRSQKWIELRKEINAYYNQKYHKLRVEFAETYFSKPWVGVSVLAAAVLLILTMLQTIYTILSYTKD